MNTTPADMTMEVPSRITEPNDPSVFSLAAIERLVQRHQLLERLSLVCDVSGIDLWVSSDEQMLRVLGTSETTQRHRSAPIVTAPIRLQQRVPAEVHGSGRSHAYEAAALLATWLEDLLTLEAEIDSLSSAIVQSYQELHLLYALGNSLGGVLYVKAAATQIVETILQPLGAVRATLILYDAHGEHVVAQAINPDAPEGVASGTASTAAALRVNDEVLGRLQIDGKLDGTEFWSNDLKLIEGVAAIAAPAIRNAQLFELACLRSETDSLTGVLNHRYIQGRIDEELERSRRYGHDLSILHVEVDHLKLFYDVYGYRTANEVLQLVANCLRGTSRYTDLIGMYGEEKFVMLLPETDLRGATQVAERILAAIRMRELVADGARLTMSVSIGVATFPEHAISKHTLIGCANTALTEAQVSGGGAVRCSGNEEMVVSDEDDGTFNVLQGLIRAIDAKDHYTQEHSLVVTEAAVLIAERMKLSEGEIRALRVAGPLHDIGKIGIPDRILKKPGKLTSEEYQIMKNHVVLSELIIRGVPQMEGVLDAVAHHHERFDGQGYPYGKSGTEIPLLGRIMGIADAYSAMCLDRPYRKGLTWAQARRELENGAGSQFDPTLVAVFVGAMDELQQPAPRHKDDGPDSPGTDAAIHVDANPLSHDLCPVSPS